MSDSVSIISSRFSSALALSRPLVLNSVEVVDNTPSIQAFHPTRSPTPETPLSFILVPVAHPL